MPRIFEERPPRAPTDVEAIARAYDAVAADYDRLVSKDLWMRKALWRHYARLFRAGDHVLDLGCGSGLDAVFLARRGIRISAVDASPQMLAVLRRAAERQGVADRIAVRQGDLTDLGALPSAGFDGVIAAFASLNTLEDPSALAAQVRRVLRPGGRLVAHMLAPPGLWQRVEHRLRGGRCAPAESDGDATIVVCGQPLAHRLLSARDTFTRFFAPCFRLEQTYALGFLWPHQLDARLPARVAETLGRVEVGLGAHSPFLDWGRFFVLDLVRRD